MRTGPPVLSTTIVCLLALATAEISEFWLLDSDRLDRSLPSLSLLPTITIATSALSAAAAAELVLLPSFTVTDTPLPATFLMPADGETVYSGATAELPLPPVCAALANGPMSAIECNPEVDSGSCPFEFFSSTAPCSPIARATAPSVLAGMDFFGGGLSKMPHLNISVNRRISIWSTTDSANCP